MIAPAYVTEWGTKATWPSRVQVEQDLILSRLIVEVANDPLLGDELLFRGGTCLHKLFLPRPLRYSEDLDYVRRTSSGIGRYLDALRVIGERIGLSVRTREFAGQMVHLYFDAESVEIPLRLTVKIEVNIAETASFVPPITRLYTVESQWWSGNANVPTFALEELLATKLRALYQRRKGRDLFDLWYVLTTMNPDPVVVVDGLDHYMADEVFTYPELAINLREKLTNRDFVSDMVSLAVEAPGNYHTDDAADLVMDRLGSLLKNAPAAEMIRNGAWRTPKK